MVLGITPNTKFVYSLIGPFVHGPIFVVKLTCDENFTQ